MSISQAMNAKLNEQITHELHASQTYLAMACLCDDLGLKALTAFFRRQADEERGHGLKILDYIQEVGGTVRLSAIPEPQHKYASVPAAIEAAVEHEKKVTAQVNALVALADKENDYATRSFLNWFVDEQVEEVSSLSHLAQLAQMAGEHLLQLEACVAKMGDPHASGSG